MIRSSSKEQVKVNNENVIEEHELHSGDIIEFVNNEMQLEPESEQKRKYHWIQKIAMNEFIIVRISYCLQKRTKLPPTATWRKKLSNLSINRAARLQDRHQTVSQREERDARRPHQLQLRRAIHVPDELAWCQWGWRIMFRWFKEKLSVKNPCCYVWIIEIIKSKSQSKNKVKFTCFRWRSNLNF